MGRSIAESLWDRLPDDIQELIQRFAEEAAFNANVKLIMKRFGVSEESAKMRAIRASVRVGVRVCVSLFSCTCSPIF